MSPSHGILTRHTSPSPLRAAIDSHHQSLYIGQDDVNNDPENLRKVTPKADVPFGEIFPML
ncbi:unnamed protein product [Anisakis simplex]|uniref:Uncharacterized protein n=1 Tax=Anisakis simplex TaxID=6269 RepID=A0A3P6PGN7_ANISI|nr:unnamed protein product [Anisakis simplex]